MSTDALGEFFKGFPDSRPIFDALVAAASGFGSFQVRVTKSEIAFLRERAFARIWIPDRYLHGRHAPLVMTIGFPYKDTSPRWKEIVEPKRGRFTHHLELKAVQEVDAEVREWLRKAWEEAA